MITINFTKEEMINLLSDYANMLYEDNPPESVFADNSVYVKDFVDGYFSETFKEEK